MALNMSSSVMWTIAPLFLAVSMAVWYMGTVPTGTSIAFSMVRRISSRLPAVLRSMRVSVPYLTATPAFSSSRFRSHMSREVPMFVFTLVRNPSPIPTG